MTAFRWIVGAFAALAALGSLASFALFVMSDAAVWLARTRRLRHWTWLALLLWFNVEVWGRVGYALLHWSH